MNRMTTTTNKERDMTTDTKTKKPAGSGGTKGQAILAAIAENPDHTRAMIAALVGCTPQRVGEVVRAAGIATAKPSRKAEPELDTPPADASAKDLYAFALEHGMSSLSDTRREVVRDYARKGKKRMPK